MLSVHCQSPLKALLMNGLMPSAAYHPCLRPKFQQRANVCRLKTSAVDDQWNMVKSQQKDAIYPHGRLKACQAATFEL